MKVLEGGSTEGGKKERVRAAHGGRVEVVELRYGGLGVEFPRVVGGRVDGVCWVVGPQRVRAERGGRVEEVELHDGE